MGYTIITYSRGKPSTTIKYQKCEHWNPEKPKIASIGDYWDAKTTKEIFNLIHKYEDLFPSSILELEGIKGDMEEMCIILKPDTRQVKHRPYHLNPRVKENVKVEIYKMLKAGLIFTMEEDEWVSPIVI